MERVLVNLAGCSRPALTRVYLLASDEGTIRRYHGAARYARRLWFLSLQEVQVAWLRGYEEFGSIWFLSLQEVEVAWLRCQVSNGVVM